MSASVNGFGWSLRQVVPKPFIAVPFSVFEGEGDGARPVALVLGHPLRPKLAYHIIGNGLRRRFLTHPEEFPSQGTQLFS